VRIRKEEFSREQSVKADGYQKRKLEEQDNGERRKWEELRSSVGGQVVVGLCWRQDQVRLHEEIQQKILNEVALRAQSDKLIEIRGEALPTKNENSSLVSNQLLWGIRHKNREG
jgi:hypothetical protein